MLEPTEENKRIDPIYYIAFANPLGIQAILYSYGFPPSNSFEDLYNQIKKVAEMYPDEVNKKLMAIHPDKEMILAASGKHFSLCSLCKSNFTGPELDTFKKEELQKSKDQLTIDLNKLKDQQVLAAGKDNSEEIIAGLQQKIDIVNELLNGAATSTGSGGQNTSGSGTSSNTSAATSSAGFSLKNLSTTEKTIGVVGILVLVTLGVVAAVK